MKRISRSGSSTLVLSSSMQMILSVGSRLTDTTSRFRFELVKIFTKIYTTARFNEEIEVNLPILADGSGERELF